MSIPYNPGALVLIRKGASARDLGWDDTFYSSICRKHGLEAVAFNARPSPSVVPTLSDSLLRVLNQVEPTPQSELPPDCTFDTSTRELRRDRHTIALRPRLAEIFTVIASVPPGQKLRSRLLAPKLGMSISIFPVMLAKLRPTLRPAGIAIVGHKGPGGGFYLRDAITGKPIRVRFLNSALDQKNGQHPS